MSNTPSGQVSPLGMQLTLLLPSQEQEQADLQELAEVGVSQRKTLAA